MSALEHKLAEARELIAAQRSRCLWWWSPRYEPQTVEEVVAALAAIERHGNTATYRQAREIRVWLSQSCNDESVA